jgi:MFS transporter, DHA1 family, tetracycline resistance protein
VSEAAEPQIGAGAPAARGGAVAFIFVTILLDMFALGLIMPILPKLVESFVDNDTASAARIFGLFGTAWALMQFFFSPILGGLSDRFGRWPVVLLSNFGLALDYVLMALAPSLTLLFVGRVISGITSASVSTAFAYIADITRRSVARRCSARSARRSAPDSLSGRRSAACSGASIRGCRSGSPRP